MSHRIAVCTSCRAKGSDTRPGQALILALRAALGSSNSVPEEYDVSGVACMAGCDSPCTVAFQAQHKATYLFGNIDPDADLDDLISYARDYALLADGWCSSVDRPGKLRTSTLARIPAAAAAAAGAS